MRKLGFGRRGHLLYHWNRSPFRNQAMASTCDHSISGSGASFLTSSSKANSFVLAVSNILGKLINAAKAYHILHNLPSAITRKIIVKVHAKIMLIALFLLFPPSHKKLETSSRQNPYVVWELSGPFVAHAFWAAAGLRLFVLFVIVVGIGLRGMVFGGRAYTDVVDFEALARI